MSQEEWEKNQAKHTADDLQHEKDMALLDALEEADKSWNHEIRTEVETFWREHSPTHVAQLEANKDRVADIKFMAVIKGHGCTAGPGSNPPFLHEKITCYQKWDTPIDAVCSECDASLIVVPETISSVTATFIFKCLGCDKALYGHKEGEIALCPKCDNIWCNINQNLQVSAANAGDYVSPMPGQILRRLSNFNGSYTDPVSYEIVKEPRNANLISSEVAGTLTHKPVLDIDLPCKLVPSTHAGHYHLYIDKVLTWDQYRKLLSTLASVGIIQQGYYNASVARGFSSVRLPWIKKEPKVIENDDTKG
jgi:hypothetical protein